MRIIVSIIVAVVLVLSGTNAHAVEYQPAYTLSDEQIEQIRTNCVASQAVIGRVHANDGLRRVNIGQQFEMIATRLMAPLNSRIALNKLDGVNLAKTTVDFNAELETFRTKYQDYEQTISGALSLNCKNQPVAYYDAIMSARSKREEVHASLMKLEDYVRQYRTEFTAFSRPILEQKTEAAQ